MPLDICQAASDYITDKKADVSALIKGLNEKHEELANIEIPLCIKEMNDIFPMHYRSKEEIRKCIEDNKISALGYTYNGTLNSFAEGKSAIANGNNSHAEGEASLSKGTASHAEGSGTLSNGNYSHAEGINTIAYGYYSHAEGTGNNSAQEAYSYTIKKDGDMNYSITLGEVPLL